MAPLASRPASPETRTVIPQAKPFIPTEDIAPLLGDFSRILSSGQLINGPFTVSFEEAAARASGVPHAVAVNSCTAALQAILGYVGISGREVIVPANTFVATANAVLFAGGTPVIADIGDNLLLDRASLAARVSRRTKAIILVHIAGVIHPEIDAIEAFCRDSGIALVEDCAHAHGASFRGRPAGSFGVAGAFSYYASKILTTGAGGMVVTRDEGLAARVRSVRFHGEDRERGIQDRIGSDWLVTEFQAALGIAQLKRLPEALQKRRYIARRYDAALRNLPGVSPIPVPAESVSGYYKYPIRMPGRSTADVKREISERYGIATGSIYWPPIHLQPAYRQFGYRKGDFPAAERILSETITLPVYPEMTDREIDRVIEAVGNISRQPAGALRR